MSEVIETSTVTVVSDFILNITDYMSLSVLHLDANSTEFDPESKHPVVSLFLN